MSISNKQNNFDFTFPLICSEIALSLYPQLIKLIPTTLDVQIAVRCISYSILGIIGLFVNNITNINQQEKKDNNNSMSLFSIIFMGCINLIHIISSYTSFKLLPSGVSYSLFYTYPIFNLLGRTIFYNEKIKLINYIYIIIAIIGVYLIYNKENQGQQENKGQQENQNNPIQTQIEIFKNKNNLNEKNETNDIKQNGFIAGIISALSESLIYFMVKSDIASISPYTQIIKTYLFGGLLSIGYLIKNIKLINLDINYWITLILFNSIIGFLGYVLRFFTIPRLSTLKFNSIIFIGVIFSYIWGYIFSGEQIEKTSIIGTLLILGSIFKINYF